MFFILLLIANIVAYYHFVNTCEFLIFNEIPFQNDRKENLTNKLTREEYVIHATLYSHVLMQPFKPPIYTSVSTFPVCGL